MSNTMLKFKYGTLNTLKDQKCVPGTVYVTKDERALYIDLPGAESTKDRIRIGDMQSYKNMQELENAIKANGLGLLTKTALYFVKEDSKGNDINALYKYDETSENFIRLNDVSDITGDLNDITETIGVIQQNIDNLQTDVKAIYSPEEKDDQGNVVAEKSGYLIDEIEAAKIELQENINEKVDTDTYNGLQGTVSELSQSFNDFKGTYEVDIEALEEQVGTNKDHIEKLQEYTNSLKEGPNSIANLINNAVAAEAEDREEAINGLDKLIKENKDAIATLEQPISTLQSELGQLAQKHNTYEASNDKALADVKKTADEAVKETVYNAKIIELEGNISGNTQAIAKLETDIGTNATNITAVTDKVNAFLNAPEVQEDVVDTLLEIQQYITADTLAFTQLSDQVGELSGAKADKSEVAAEIQDRETAITNLRDEILDMLSWGHWEATTSNEPEEV